MNGIIGMTELALDTDLTGEQREYLLAVKSSADALLTIINDILDFSKIEAGKLELDAVDFLLRDCLGDALKAIAVRADAKGLELRLRGLPRRARRPPRRSRPAAPGRRQPRRQRHQVHRARRSRSSMSSRSAAPPTTWRCCFSVTRHRHRHRPGQAGSHLRALHPGRQLHHPHLRRHRPRPHHLHPARRAAWAARSPSTASSAAAASSASPPISPLAHTPASGAGVPAPRSTACRVLVVDDNATNRRILVDTLRHWAMRATAVASAAEGPRRRRRRRSEPFDLVLLDANMPEMDGFMFAERLAGSRTSTASPS